MKTVRNNGYSTWKFIAKISYCQIKMRNDSNYELWSIEIYMCTILLIVNENFFEFLSKKN